MSRGMDSTQLAAAQANQVIGCLMVDMAWKDSSGNPVTLYVTNAPFSFMWNGNQYAGVGYMGSIQNIEEGNTVQSYNVTLRLTGLDVSLVAASLADDYQGQPATIRMAFMTSNYQIIDSPVIIYSGRIDKMIITMGDTATISVTVESRLADLERPRIRRYNLADQQLTDPTDTGFQFAPYMTERQFWWGVGVPNS